VGTGSKPVVGDAAGGRPLERRDEEPFDGVDGQAASADAHAGALGTDAHDIPG